MVNKKISRNDPRIPLKEKEGETLAYVNLKLQIVKTYKNCITINVIISSCNIAFSFNCGIY
jgi:hypothetical protein